MRLGAKSTIIHGVGTILACLLVSAMAYGQATPAERPQMADELFKNVQVLKGIPVNEFLGIMGFFSASLGKSCVDCHDSDRDRKSTRLNSSHGYISYAVFCLKKKKSDTCTMTWGTTPRSNWASSSPTASTNYTTPKPIEETNLTSQQLRTSTSTRPPSVCIAV